MEMKGGLFVELTVNIVIIVLYILSILNLGFAFMKMGVCHSSPEGARMARRQFLVAFFSFIGMSIVMMFRFSLWFAVPLTLVLVVLLVVPSLFFLYEEMIYKIDIWKEKKKAI
jgi:cell division protein FtsW (lipid II flippase)